MNEMDLDQMADDIVEQQKPQPKSNLDINTLKTVKLMDSSFTDYDKLLIPTPTDERESLLNPTIYQSSTILTPERLVPYNDINEQEVSTAFSDIIQRREYSQRPEIKQAEKEKRRIRDVIPENRERARERSRQPEIKQYMKEYKQRPEYKQQQKEYNQRPEVKEKIYQYHKKYYEKKKSMINELQEGMNSL